MPQGIQIRDGSGNLTFDFTDRTTTVLGEVAIQNGAGELYDDRFYNGTPFYTLIRTPPGFLPYFFDNFGFSGNRFYWNFPFATSEPVLVIYGIY